VTLKPAKTAELRGFGSPSLRHIVCSFIFCGFLTSKSREFK